MSKYFEGGFVSDCGKQIGPLDLMRMAFLAGKMSCIVPLDLYLVNC